jgi:hypothetical protein
MKLVRIPPAIGAREALPTLTRNMAAARFGVAPATIAKWCAALGVQTRELTIDERCEMARRGGQTRARNAGRPVKDHATDTADPWARDLYLQALRAFDLARSKVTEEDYV